MPVADASTATSTFLCYIASIQRWVGTNRVKLNMEKTQLIWICTRHQLERVTGLKFQSTVVLFYSAVADL